MSMKRRKHIGVCRKFCARTPEPFAFSTHCAHSAWRWLDAIVWTPTRTRLQSEVMNWVRLQLSWVNPESFRTFRRRGLILSYPIWRHNNTHHGLWRDGLWRYELAGDWLCGTGLLAARRGMVFDAI